MKDHMHSYKELVADIDMREQTHHDDRQFGAMLLALCAFASH